MAFSGQKYLFVWRNNTLSNANNYIAGRIMNADGSFATGNFTIAEAPGRQLRPVVGWDGTNFVVAWDDQRNQGAFFDERTDIYGARVSPAGQVLDPVAFPIYVGPQGDATAAILSRTDGVSFVASARFVTTTDFDSYRVGVTVLGLDQTAVAAEGVLPGRALLHQNVPNPFNPATTVRFNVERAGRVQVTVHDVAGREVAVLARGEFPAGEHKLVWDGRDDHGRPAGSGTYFLRLEADGYLASQKMALIK